MRSGKLRYRVILQRRVDSQAQSGQVVHAYQDIAEVGANIMPGRGREFFASAQIQAEAPAEIKIRYRADLDTTCRVVRFHGEGSPQQQDVYDILAVAPDEKTMRRDLLLYCNQRFAEGWRG